MVHRFFAAIVILGVGATTIVQAADLKTIPLTAEDKADLEAISAHFRQVKNVKARFSQASDQGTAEGDLYVSRPGRLRLDYDAPTPIQLLADGTWLITVDRELKSANRLPLSQTPVRVLLEENINLATTTDVAITAISRQRDQVRLTIQDPEYPDQGKLQLVFSRRPVDLLFWQVEDATGQTTTVTIYNAEIGANLPKSMFSYTEDLDPESHKNRNR